MLNILQMHSDLVRPAGFQFAVDQRYVSEPLDNGIVCYGMSPPACVRVNGKNFAITGATVYVSFNSPGIFFEITPNQSQVMPISRMMKKLRSKLCL